MRILVSTTAVPAAQPKAPYDGFTDCISCSWGGEFTPTATIGIAPNDAKLVRTVDPSTAELLSACALSKDLNVFVLYERMGATAPFVHLVVNLAQAKLTEVTHEGTAGSDPVPLERLSFRARAINGTYYDESGRELGRTSFGAR